MRGTNRMGWIVECRASGVERGDARLPLHEVLQQGMMPSSAECEEGAVYRVPGRARACLPAHSREERLGRGPKGSGSPRHRNVPADALVRAATVREWSDAKGSGFPRHRNVPADVLMRAATVREWSDAKGGVSPRHGTAPAGALERAATVREWSDAKGSGFPRHGTAP